MPDMREDFEAWLRETGRRFFGETVREAYWIAWQASRAAMKVELPKQSIYANSIGDYARGFNAARAADKEALQQAGIEVK